MYVCMYVCMDGWMDGWMDVCMFWAREDYGAKRVGGWHAKLQYKDMMLLSIQTLVLRLMLHAVYCVVRLFPARLDQCLLPILYPARFYLLLFRAFYG